MREPPFAKADLDFEIETGESDFRAAVNAARSAYQAGDLNEVRRFRTNCAEIASTLAELRYQRERIT